MDLRQMRYLIALAEELNFTRAAQRCNVSQPPFSRAIRELERELDAQLFERDKHHVALTAAGRSLVNDARKALALLEDGAENARRTAHGLSGLIMIGFGGSTSYALVPSLVRRFRERAPDVAFRFKAMPVLNQIDALRNGEIDIGVLRLPVFDELIETQFVREEPLMVALPTGHKLLATSGAISISALRDDRFVTYEPTRGFGFHADLLALCRFANFLPELAHQAPTTEAVIGIVGCAEGVAVVPASAERLRIHGVAFRALEALDAPDDLIRVRFGLAWRKRQLSPSAAKLVALAAEQVRSA